MMKDVLLKRLKSYSVPLMGLLLTISTCLGAFAQTRQITGKVTGEDGSGMPGVSVRVKGTATGTTTDVNGIYKISAANNTVLSFSFIGYAPQDVTVGDGTTYNVKLAPDSKTLVEVNVVSVGYGSSKKRDLTGSIASVSAKQIEAVPVTTLDQAVQGRAAGVQVINNDGSPGGSVNIQIRGIGTLGNSTPLYVIDGYPTESINNLNPNDIATIDILKDASSTAIYGNRAANGVVIITTKRGGKSAPSVEFDATDAFQARPKTYKVLDAQTWAKVATDDAIREGTTNGGVFTPAFSVLPQWNDPSSLHEADWQKAVYQSGLRQNYNFAVRGGGEKLQTSFSAGYIDQKGIVLGSDYKRLNLSTNLDYNVGSWLRSSTSFKYSRSDSKVPFSTGGQGATSGIGYLSKLPPTLDGGSNITSDIKDSNGNYGFYNPTNASPVRNWGSGPVYQIENNDQKNQTNYFIGTSSLEATIYDGLKIKTNFGINENDNSGYNFNPSDLRAQNQYGAGTQTSQNNYSQYANNNYEWLWENYLSYDKTFGKHTIHFVGGVSEQKNTYRFMNVSGTNLPNDQLRALDFLTTVNPVSGYEVPLSQASQFARLNYQYEDKYYVTGTVRRDGSSRFAPGHQYGTFPSGSVAWRAKSEDFLKNADWLSELKFRASYGEIGNELNAGNFQYLAQYTPGPAATAGDNDGYPFGKSGNTPGLYQPGLVLTALPDPNLKWETSKQTDIAADMAFLGGNLTFTVDYYDKKSKDFLLQVNVPAQTGFTYAQRNVGSIDNKGFEFAVNYAHTVNGDFHYNLGLNITTVKNTLESLATGQTFIDNLGNLGFSSTGSNNWVTYSHSVVGGPVGEFYGYKSDGIFQSQAEINSLDAASVAKNGAGNFYQANGGPTKTASPGDRKFKDLNGDGRITADDQTALGSPIPKFYGGLNFDATYKAFDINLFFYGVYGNKIFNYQERTLESFASSTGSVGIENIGQKYYENAWTPENHSNRYTVITANDFNVNTRPSDVYVENGSYLRLKNVTLGYTLPTDISKKLTLTKVRFFVSAQNLFTITGYSGLDPEIGTPADTNNNRLPTAAGIDVGTYPNSRFYTLGLNVTF